MSQRGLRAPMLDRKARFCCAGFVADLDERMVERALASGYQAIHPAWRPIRAEAMAAGTARGGRDRASGAAALLTSHDRIFELFDAYLRTQRTVLALKSHHSVISLSSAGSCTRYAPLVTTTWARLQLPPGGGDPGYIERHAQDCESWNREGDVLVAASLSPVTSIIRGREPTRVGGLRAVDATVEAREPADFSAWRPGAEGTRWLRIRQLPIGTAGLRHSDDASQARPAGPTRSRRSHSMISTGAPARCSFAPRADSGTDADPAGAVGAAYRWISAQWPPKVVVSALVHPRARAVCRLCFWVCDRR